MQGRQQVRQNNMDGYSQILFGLNSWGIKNMGYKNTYRPAHEILVLIVLFGFVVLHPSQEWHQLT